jgi:hypothetical protein
MPCHVSRSSVNGQSISASHSERGLSFIQSSFILHPPIHVVVEAMPAESTATQSNRGRRHRQTDKTPATGGKGKKSAETSTITPNVPQASAYSVCGKSRPVHKPLSTYLLCPCSASRKIEMPNQFHVRRYQIMPMWHAERKMGCDSLGVPDVEAPREQSMERGLVMYTEYCMSAANAVAQGTVAQEVLRSTRKARFQGDTCSSSVLS